MRNCGLFILFGLCALLFACVETPPVSVPPSDMTIESPAFDNGAVIPEKYTCDGEGVSPPLVFSAVPNQTQSLVLIVSDPDAPGGDFVHWVMFGIEPKVTAVSEGAVPPGSAQGVTSTGKPGYVGPCPPSGVHRYLFHLSALDTVLQFETVPAKANLLKAMQGHILTEAELMGRYRRP